jgi:hypothetical protein
MTRTPPKRHNDQNKKNKKKRMDNAVVANVKMCRLVGAIWGQYGDNEGRRRNANPARARMGAIFDPTRGFGAPARSTHHGPRHGRCDSLQMRHRMYPIARPSIQ